MRTVLLSLLAIGFLAGAETGKTDFVREVRPILSDRCFTCHGPDEQQRKMNLRLDTEEGAREVLANGKLAARVGHEKKALRMPPPNAGAELTPTQIATLKKWVEEGAEWKQHWSYVPPKRAEVPAGTHAIDHFIRERLAKDNLKPAPPASRAVVLRRVSFDLTGLPPTPAEVDAFVADKSKDAYEKVVDRLLASPRYGERMAMQWLDLARYADTHGFHIDSHRDMWTWRDWLISAFNSNMRFDQFTREQLAGDLIPNARRDQLLASAFNRNHMINFEGGAIPEEYQTEYVVDRVETTSNVWMAMTMGCARCHDHKYDPIKQKEFYEFFAFFNTVAEKGLDGIKGNAEPVLRLPDSAQEASLARLREAIAMREDALDAADVTGLRTAWEADWAAKTDGAYPKSPSSHGLVAHYEFDGGLTDASGHYRHGRAVKGEVTFTPGAADRAAAIDARTELELPGLSAVNSSDEFAATLWVKLSARLDSQDVVLLNSPNGWKLWMDGGIAAAKNKRLSHVYVNLGDHVLRSVEPVETGEWTHIAINAGPLPQLFVNAKPRPMQPYSGPAPAKQWMRGSLDDIRIYNRRLEPAEIETVAVDFPNQVTLTIQSAKRSREQRLMLLDYFFLRGAPAGVQELNGELTAFYRERERLLDEVPSAMVMREMGVPRDTWILGRGDYRNHGEKVNPSVPAMLPPLPKDALPNRLGLADWLLDPSHPLTSRVAANRYWQMYFGTGLVKTAEDFGSQGELPSHPELLDWLATEFIRTGWDIRAMQRLIVTSAAYKQASNVTPALLEKDPENRLLARGPRFRLPAEMVRDNALAIAGLLVEKQGGPSVYPYQPKGVWEDIAYGDTFSAQIYSEGSGPEQVHRRSMYSFWKRTAPPPTLATFDAPDREKCTIRRAMTNTPLQALVLMNDPTFVEAARALAVRMMKEAGPDPRKRIAAGYRAALARRPTAKETQVLTGLVGKQLALFRAEPENAKRLLSVGEFASAKTPEVAAWTMLASTLLNLDEVITKQ